MMKRTTLGLTILLGSMVYGAAFAEQVSSTADQKAVAVTIYNNNLAMVRDQRQLSLSLDNNTVAFEGVSALIKPETASLGSKTQPNPIQMIEQSFEFDLLSPNALLEASVGKTITVVNTNPATGEQIKRRGTVLSTQGGVVLQFDDSIETNPQGQFIFDALPKGVRARPTLVMQLDNQREGVQELELNYLTGGLSWEANYVATLADDEQSLDINAWVTLSNQSGADYDNAELQLVAGDINQVSPKPQMVNMADGKAMVRASADREFATSEVFDYHLYQLNRSTDLNNNQTKQIALLGAASVPVNKSYVLQLDPYFHTNRGQALQDNLKVSTQLRFMNDEKSGLGSALPRGTVRFYQNNDDGRALFIGEDRIDHSPKNKAVTLSPGSAFDITAKREQIAFEQLPKILSYRSNFKSTSTTTIYNAKTTAVTVRVEENLLGKWSVEDGPQPDEKNANSAVWLVEIPAESETSLTYTVKMRY